MVGTYMSPALTATGWTAMTSAASVTTPPQKARLAEAMTRAISPGPRPAAP
ncbi:hypothetical protein [Sphingobium bisphenolivorans]|uniref:hypothetical protein n=1 Tax=Sphingobium bisphenolivorans TaxID=1335760 RepID=UPI001EE75DF6|nr:hypothetical protein [Sphingobium bisphenolivorans]